MVVHIGTSGWSYQHWNGVLYDPTSHPRDRLAVYTRQFDTVELNASFYRWPRPATFANWRRRMPTGVVMSVKALNPAQSRDDQRLDYYAGSYSDQDMARWADRIREWSSSGRDVYAYFNNDGDGNAVHNAQNLRQFLGA